MEYLTGLDMKKEEREETKHSWFEHLMENISPSFFSSILKDSRDSIGLTPAMQTVSHLKVFNLEYMYKVPFAM